jgi:hypothetical protein
VLKSMFINVAVELPYRQWGMKPTVSRPQGYDRVCDD